ncbi:hypothetical protein Tco_0268346 [Tanacetum coccineum]
MNVLSWECDDAEVNWLHKAIVMALKEYDKVLQYETKAVVSLKSEEQKVHAPNGSIKYNRLSREPPKVNLSRATSAGGLTYLYMGSKGDHPSRHGEA